MRAMTDPLALLKELDAARTPGPWNGSHGHYFDTILHDGERRKGYGFEVRDEKRHLLLMGTRGEDKDRADADARFIAACSTAVPLLIEVVEAARRHRLTERGFREPMAVTGGVEDTGFMLDAALAALTTADTPGKGQ
jgi:hypothetical protein